ncbi:MAG: S-layer homology domain-containing protein [Thermincola sp.]|jgi:hypothetical protein|nr:S-layer homology domain-containing protein [Thermincola sp.]MDT3703480.1 S-layer homology domain-containing protein [Thermincola sp.]
MRKIKRFIALVTVAMFLLSLAAPASAATKEESFGRLNAVGVAYGDASGDPQYDKNFTRAEAAAIMVQLSGMKAAIDAAKGPTKFKDVPASHWATGVINLAVGANIIKGYPDGTYKPDANVTYAEMSAMLVGVLGYTPKLQGTWPANVISKAAQLGLLDGVSATDYNAAAVRSNVFLAADNALDTNPLKETRDGYEEDTKTLMENKLNVTVKKEGTITAVPNTSGVKEKVSIDYTDAAVADGTLDVAANVDANSVLGLKVEAWVKDDKVFFFNVKTNASDIITDKLDAALTDVDGSLTPNANDTIHVDKLDKNYTLDAGVVVFKNYVSAGLTNASIANNDEVKLVLNNGKVKYLIATAFTTAMVEKVNTTDEKLTFEVAGSLELKDKVNTIVKGGKAIALADIKAGNVVDYITTADSRYIVVSDGVVEGKLEAAATDGKKVTLSGKEISTNDAVKISTNNGDTYGATSFDDGSDYSAHFGKNIKAFTNKDGKIAFMIASEGDASSYIPVLVKDIKRTTGGATEATYLYIAKFDGTETYYEINKDTKLNGTKITKANVETADRGATITNGADNVVRGDVVKITLTSDNKIDAIKTFAAADVVNPLGGTADFTANKTADTIVSTTDDVAYKVDANTKLLKVKAYKDDDNATTDTNIAHLGDTVNGTPDGQYIWIDDIDTLTWAAMENLGNVPDGRVAIVKDSGVAKYIVLYTKNTATSSSFKYGMVTNLTANADGTAWTLTVDGASVTKQFDSGDNTIAKKDVIKFKLSASDKITNAAKVTAKSVTVGAGNYSNFKVKSIDKTNKRVEVIAVAGATADADEAGNAFWVDYSDNTKLYDTEDTTKAITVDDLSGDDIIQLYDAFDKDSDDSADGSFDAAELIYDFIERVDK